MRRQQLGILGLTVIGVGIVVSGFFLGRAIGAAGDDGSKPGSVPERIVTRAAVPAAPALGKKAEIPPLRTTDSAASEPETEEEAAPVSADEEMEEAPTPNSTPEPSPEVTVAPSR